MTEAGERRRDDVGRVLGLDVGGKRIGVAVSDDLGTIASPVGFVLRGQGDRTEFRRLIDRYGARRLVVGLPAGLSGREGPQAADVRAYAESLANDLDLPFDYWDERLTTAIAERSLIESGSRRERRKEQVDAVAAAVMLQGFLDAAVARSRGFGSRHR
jgi:putative Holliday junction resolvase